MSGVITMIKDVNECAEFTKSTMLEFMAEANRMCKSYRLCEYCPLSLFAPSLACVTSAYDMNSINKQIEIIEKWSEKHPKNEETE